MGLPLALVARTRGHSVVGVESDARRHSQIKNAAVPDLEDVFTSALRRDPLTVTKEFNAVKDADVVVVCVPTPVDHDHQPDITILKDVCVEIAKNLQKGKLIVIESTVNPGTADEVLIPLMEEHSGLKAGVDFGIAHCPERINPGDSKWPVEKIPRVIGATTKEALVEASEFYRSILNASVHEMGSVREAEAVKMVENSFRDVNIAFVNELAMSFNKLNIDVTNVLKGASTKPFGFMLHLPGCGVGGHCIPVDPYYLIRYAKKNGFNHKFLALAREINNGMPEFTIELLEKELAKKGKDLRGSRVALLGLSYKANVSDLRESPALEIAHMLVSRGAELRTFDPYIRERSTAASLSDALKSADAIVVATAHGAFCSLTPAVLKQYGISIVIDGRNCLDKEAFTDSGIVYRGIGR